MNARRWWGWPLVPVYWAGLRTKDALRAAGILRVRQLGWPVVSAGSLSAGGAGKTPVVIALAELLKGRGWGVDVLSRGYGRTGSGVEQVNAGASDAALRFGDESVLIARTTGAQVWVGAERYEAGVAAEHSRAYKQKAGPSTSSQDDNFKQVSEKEEHGRRVHLLDDGFQHRQLARALDVVMVTAEDLADALLPAGNLREGLWALQRADVVVVREEEREHVDPRLRGLIRGSTLLWTVRRRLHLAGPSQTNDGEAAPGERPLVFCAIARPEGFRAMLAQVGCNPVEMICFADHYAYAMDDIERLMESAQRLGASGFVTTEKDQVKLTGEMLEQLETIGPVTFARLEVNFLEEERVVRELEARIR